MAETDPGRLTISTGTTRALTDSLTASQERVVTAGFELLKRRYGAMWIGALRAAGWSGPDAAVAHWAAELADVPEDALARAFEGWREPGPPNLMELRGRCAEGLRVRPEHQLAQPLRLAPLSEAERAAGRERWRRLRESLG